MSVTANCGTSPTVPGLLMRDVDNSNLHPYTAAGTEESEDCLIAYCSV